MPVIRYASGVLDDGLFVFGNSMAEVLNNVKLTPKQRAWLKYYIETGNATEAARLAGYQAQSSHTFEQIGYENLRKLEIPITDLMDQMGLSDAFLMSKLRDGLDAMTVKTASDKGMITDEREYVDFPTRQGYLDMALKLKGKYPAERKVVEGDPEKPIVVKVLKGISMDDL